MKPAMLVRGMHGLGDNIRQRAILRQKMPRYDVYLESSWVSVYHDLIGDGLKVVHKHTSLRTQTKNAQREAGSFWPGRPPLDARRLNVTYPPDTVRREGSVLGAMCRATGCDLASADFRLPLPASWRGKARAWLERWRPQRPLLIYRPLVDRPADWGGCNARNPDEEAYAALFDSIRHLFFVVSVADLVPGKEWMVGLACEADAYCHAGELDFETLAAVTAEAGMVFCSPGFAAVLAQAVGTPVACVFGGYERSAFFFAGAKDAPCLGIDPIHPCECFKHDHACDKTIDIRRARAQLADFAARAAARRASAT